MTPGDIHWVELPPASPHEQMGRRPAIILQDETYAGSLPLVIVLPLTGALAAARFAGTLHVPPTDRNGLHKPSVALVFQIRAVDRRIVREKLGVLETEAVTQVYALLDRLIGRPHSLASRPSGAP